MEDVPSSSPTEQPRNITVSDDTVRVETLPTNPSVARQTSLSTSSAVDRKRGRPRLSDTPPTIHASSKNWGTILAKLTFQLDDCLQEHLENRNNYDPSPFLGNTEFESLPTPKCKDFFDFCVSISKMPKKDPVERVSRLFLLIRVGEMAHQLFGPHWSNERSTVLKTMTSNELDPASFGELKKVLRLSDRLMFICDCSDFGIGSIFWLHNELSSDNL